MADRCMLFAARTLPGRTGEPTAALALGEFSYAIPTLYKLLVSVDPQPCASLVLDGDQPMAIAGSRQGGLARLKSLRARLGREAEAADSLDEAIAYLDKAHINHPFFILEPGEIFDLAPTPVSAQMDTLLAVVRALDDEALASLAEETNEVEHWASGSWSDILYYQPAGSERPPILADTTFLLTTPSHVIAHREALAECTALRTVYLELDGDQAGFAEALAVLGNIPAPFELTVRGPCEELPSTVAHLTNVTTLVLGMLGLRKLPEELAELPRLKGLYLQTNGIEVVPAFIGRMQGLTQLSLRQNPLRTLPDWIGKLSALETLWLDECALTQMPDSLGDLRNLKTLVLSSNPSLGALPGRVSELQALEELNLYDCGLDRLPEGVCRLSRLRALFLAKNRLTELPRCLYSMPLETLSLADNPLRKPSLWGFMSGPKFRAKAVYWK